MALAAAQAPIGVHANGEAPSGDGGAATDRIPAAMRLGWAMAEVLGRNRLGDDARVTRMVTRERGQTLPLAKERTPAEKRIEAEKVLGAMAGTLDLDEPAMTKDPDAPEGTPPSRWVTTLAKRLAEARKSDNNAKADELWAQLAGFIRTWDCGIQDTFAKGEFGTASAYQLGRGLAEVYWALEPSAASTNTASWDFLLGDERCRELRGLIRRLSSHLPDFTADALVHSLDSWHAVVKDPKQRRRPDAVSALREQADRWRDLLLTGYKPDVVLPADERVDYAKRIRRVLAAFRLELGLTLLGLLALLGAFWLIGDNNHIVGAIFAALSAFGVTTAGALAKIKSTAQDLFDQLGHALEVDIISDAATALPGDATG